MFGFIQKLFIATMTFVGSGTLMSSNPLKCVSMSNQKCKVRPVMVNIDSNEFYFIPTAFL